MFHGKRCDLTKVRHDELFRPAASLQPPSPQSALAQMNALPDISGNDSERLRKFMRITALEIKAVGGVGAATSLEMIGYIRELEMKLAKGE